MTTSDSKQALTITKPAFLVNGSDAEFRILINRLLYFSARLLTVRDGFGAIIGLSGIQYSILMSIKALSSQGEVTVNQLAEHLHFSGSFVTMETGKLRTRNLITKKRHDLDRRKIVLDITEAGKKLLSDLTGTQQAINDILFENLNTQQAKMLYNVLGQLVSNCDAATLELSHLVSRLNIQQGSSTRSGAV